MRGRISILIALILITSCFFYFQNYSFRAKAMFLKGSGGFLVKKGGAGFSREDFAKRNKASSQPDIPIMVKFHNFCPTWNKLKKLSAIEKELYAITRGYPIEEMVPYIARYDRRTAALIIGIAKKESDWGKRSPSKNGKTCYNYWGYKAAGSRGRVMNYGCFSSPREAVEVIGGRIKELVGENLNTPSKMIVWKCGSSCAGHSRRSVRKWISDVNIYFEKIVSLFLS